MIDTWRKLIHKLKCIDTFPDGVDRIVVFGIEGDKWVELMQELELLKREIDFVDFYLEIFEE